MAKTFQVDTGGTLTNGLQAYYKLEDATDFWSTKNMSSVGSPTFDAGKVNNGVDGGSSNPGNYLSVSDNLGIDGGVITIAGWVNVTTSGTDIRPITQSTATAKVAYMMRYDGSIVYFYRNKIGVAAPAAQVTQTLTTGTWYFLIGSYDGAAISISVNNGTPGTNTDSGNGTGASSNLFRIMSDSPTAGSYWTGKVDEVGIWNRTLTSQEKIDLYNGGSGQTMIGPTTSTAKRNFLMGVGQ